MAPLCFSSSGITFLRSRSESGGRWAPEPSAGPAPRWEAAAISVCAAMSNLSSPGYAAFPRVQSWDLLLMRILGFQGSEGPSLVLEPKS